MKQNLGKDRNGIPLLPDLVEIDLETTFDYDRHSDDGCPLMVEVEIESLLQEAEQEMLRIIKAT